MTKQIGLKIKHLRKSKFMSQEEMSEKANIKRSTLSNYETGRRTPHMKELSQIAEFFGVGLDYFGVEPHDEVFNLLTRAKEVFQSPTVSRETKEDLYREFMKLYLNIKDDVE